MIKTVCDGCGSETAEIVLAGDRVNKMQGGGIPEGAFHLCIACAQAAFSALRQARLLREGMKNMSESINRAMRPWAAATATRPSVQEDS